MSKSINGQQIQSAINELKDCKSPLFGTKYKIQNKLKQRIKKKKNFESVINLKKQSQLNSNFKGIKTLALKCGVLSESKEYKRVIEEGKYFLF